MARIPGKYFNAPLSQHRADRKVYGEKILLVEGPDDIWFFDQLLSDLGAPDTIQIIDYEGIANLHRTFATLLLDDRVRSGSVTCIAVVQDADSNEAAARNNVENAFTSESLMAPAFGDFVKQPGQPYSTGAFILPELGKTGNLDSLLYGTMVGSDVYAKTETYVTDTGLLTRNDIDKRRTQVYLAAQDSLCRGAGRGAANGFFDLSHANVGHIRDFLTKLVAAA